MRLSRLWRKLIFVIYILTFGCSVSYKRDFYANYPKVSEFANIVYSINSNKYRTHFFVDGQEIAVGRRVKILIDNYSHTIVAQPEGCISKEEFIQPPYSSYSPLSFTFLIGECNESITKIPSKLSHSPTIVINILNNKLDVLSQDRSYTLETTEKEIKVEVEVYKPSVIKEVLINGEKVNKNSFGKYVKYFGLDNGINIIDLSAKAINNRSITKSITVVRKDSEKIKKHAHTGYRTALVIGNGSYSFISNLKNPANDAVDMANVLSQLGFDVNTLLNADQEKIEDAINDFGKKLTLKGGVGLFYYAGHGIQMNGENYLIPVNINLKRKKDLRYKAVSVSQVLDEMKRANNALNIVILDACRDNPLPSDFRSFSGGLARLDSPRGTLIAFATSPGSTAQDGEGRNGTYTKYLLKYIQTPNLTIEEVFKKVLQDVDKETNGDQTPWVSSSFIGDFYFNRKSLDREQQKSNLHPSDP